MHTQPDHELTAPLGSSASIRQDARQHIHTEDCNHPWLAGTQGTCRSCKQPFTVKLNGAGTRYCATCPHNAPKPRPDYVRPMPANHWCPIQEPHSHIEIRKCENTDCLAPFTQRLRQRDARLSKTCGPWCSKQRNRQKRRQTTAAHRAGTTPKRTNNNAAGTITWNTRLMRIAGTQRHLCAECRHPFDYTNHQTKRSPTLDHLQPLLPEDGSPPGDDTDANLQALCRSCNASKGNRITQHQTRVV